MSLERVLQLLKSFGFSRVDAEVYIYLAKTGSQRGKDLADGLKMSKQQLYPILKNLQGKGVVISSSTRPALFSALAFEELLHLYVKLKIDQAQIITENKDELLESWRNVTQNGNN
jgi:sugar-specific transcriptional regulator TrmB